MRSPSLTPALACLPVVLAGAAQAQSARPSSSFAHSLGVTTGVTFTDRFDATASPRPFGGVGTAATLRYRYEPGAWSIDAEVSGAHSGYEPHDQLSGSEQAFAGGVALRVEREAATIGKTSLRLGLDLDTRGEGLEHHYADAARTIATFITGFSTLGPTASVRRSIAGGDVSATAVVPVVGLVHQPYANTRDEREPVSVRAAGVSALHGGSFAVRYESSASARMGVIAEYRLRSFDYSAGWRTRSITNSTAIGVITRFGSKAR